MPDLMQSQISVTNPRVYDYKIIGTAAGTTTIMAEPGILAGVWIPARVASGAITLYDSVGTSLILIGTIALGTQTFSDSPPVTWLNIRTKTALTAVNSANQGAVILFGK